MSGFNQARKNMVDCQIHTAGVNTPAVLGAFETVPREKFVPKAYRDISYLGEDLPMGEGRFLLEPSVHARMIEALEIGGDEMVLDISLSNGYSAALLSKLASTVVTVDPKPSYVSLAAQIWDEIDVRNVAAFEGKLVHGWSPEAPYDVIFIGGAVGEIPEVLAGQLSPGGRMVCIVKKPGEKIGQAVLVRKGNKKNGEEYSTHALFEAGAPYLPGFEPKPSFSFS